MNTRQRELDLTQALAAERTALKLLFALSADSWAAPAVAAKSPTAPPSAQASATTCGR
ncbi:MAG: hypothetical protein H6R17_2234 [Proteobacteria bacterium]|nr:hypothetical protein [Pseudomonadota bacterium]